MGTLLAKLKELVSCSGESPLIEFDNNQISCCDKEEIFISPVSSESGDTTIMDKLKTKHKKK